MKQTLSLAGLFSKTPISRFFVMTAIAALMLLAVSCGKKEEPAAKVLIRPVKVITVAGQVDAGLVSLPGRTRANRRADLSFKVAGPLVELPAEEGKEIQKGQLIARIDPRDFETGLKQIKSSLSGARANLKSMQKGARIEDIRMLESEIDAAKSEYLYAEDQYKRYKQLWKKQLTSKVDFDRHTNLRNTAKARLAAARQDLAKGKRGARKEDIEAQQSIIRGLVAQLKAAQDALDDTYLKAPFTGVVAKRYVENHQEVQAKQPVVFFQDISKIEILIDVPETLMAQIREGEQPDAVARFAAAPDRSFPLTLKEFSTEADPQTQTYQVVLEMTRPEGINILPGMTVTVDGHTKFSASDSSRIVIPAIAVTYDSEKNPFVWVVDEQDMKSGAKTGMTLKKTMIRVGELTGTDGIVILDGLIPGQKIVTAGVTKLQAGMKVSIWDTSK